MVRKHVLQAVTNMVVGGLLSSVVAPSAGCAAPTDNTRGGVEPEPKGASTGAAAAGTATAGAAAATAEATGSPSASGEPPRTTILAQGTLKGFCEASAVIPWEGGYLIADNEDEENLYLLGKDPKGDQERAARPFKPDYDVRDVEALVDLGTGKVALIGSHSNSSTGEFKKKRHRVQVEGEPAREIDLSKCEACPKVDPLPPKEGGFSIEGATLWNGSLWLGVRSPLQGGKALLLEMEGSLPGTGRVAVKTVRPVDLGKRGVRDLAVRDGSLFVLAGPLDDTKVSHALYRIERPGGDPTLVGAGLPGHSEGIAPAAAPNEWIVVTDGKLADDGGSCAEASTWLRIKL